MKDYFPLFISLKNKKILVIGGGKVGERKIKKLFKYSPKIKIVSEEITSGLKRLVDKGLIEWKRKLFEEKDLEDSTFLVITATDKKDLNDYIHKLCEDKGILVNNVSERGRVIFPAVVEDGEISIAISTSGSLPFLAKVLKIKIREIIRPYSKLIKIIKPLRSSLLTENNNSSYNKTLLSEIFPSSLPMLNSEEELDLIKEKVKDILRNKSESDKKI